jgi:uncharacterized membrane protein
MIKRTLLKTISYAIMHMTVSISVAYALSRNWKVALAIGFIEPVVQTIAFFFHERAWHRYERQHHRKDYHDSVIDSVSPAGGVVEKFLHRRKKRI